MKNKIILITAIILLSQTLKGQTLDDALRYSQSFYQGTARFNAMGGAFTALGGDLSAIPLNPASASLIRSVEFALTPQLSFNNTKTYFTNPTTDYASKVSLSQIGFASSLNLGSGSGLKGLTFSYSYNKTNIFNMRAVIDGTSTESSMADYWAADSYNINKGDLADYTSGGYMAYQTYLIDTISGYNDRYASVFSVYGDEPAYVYGQRTKRIIDNSGNSGEHTIAFSANIGDKLYLGTSIGLTDISYTGHYQHSEWDEANNIPLFGGFTYTDHFEDDGTGVNFKVGAIFRPVESVKLGLSFHSPTVYNIDEYYYSGLTSEVDYFNIGVDEQWDIQTEGTYYSYKLRTPSRINAGVAIQIGSSAIVSADYEFVDYSNAKMSKGSDGYTFSNENDDIKSTLKNTGNLRLGAEYRLGALYMRGGYRYYGSAFRDETLNKGRDYSGYSLGLGYRQKGVYFDFAYSALMSSEKYMMYPDEYLDPLTIESTNNNFTATLGFKF